MGKIDKIIEDQRYVTNFGVLDIGHFAIHVNIHKAMELGYSMKDLCEIASTLRGRVDNQMNPTKKPISPRTVYKYYKLESIPKGFAFMTITKDVETGGDLDQNDEEALKNILMDNNSYGHKIVKDLKSFIKKRKGKYLGRRINVHGMNDWNAVGYTAICIVELNKYGQLDAAVSVQDTLNKFKEAESINGLEGETSAIGISIR